MSYQNTTGAPATVDAGRIRVGAGFRLLSAPVKPSPVVASADVADTSRIRVGAAFRLLAKS